MNQVDRYLNFVNNYNAALEKSGSNWLGPSELGEVVLRSATENVSIERAERTKKYANNNATTKQKAQHQSRLLLQE